MRVFSAVQGKLAQKHFSGWYVNRYKNLVSVVYQREVEPHILPHESSSNPLSSFAVSIDKVEQITGIDFFHAVEDSLKEDLNLGITVHYGLMERY